MLMRDFASSELQLPDNASYRSYADLQRQYVLWNIVAAPEFSLEAENRLLFPIAGCLAYRGFFDQSAAQRHAEQLQATGLRCLAVRHCRLFHARLDRRPAAEYLHRLQRQRHGAG